MEGGDKMTNHREDGEFGEGVTVRVNDHPACRVCGNKQYVAVWREDAPQDTICMGCCSTTDDGHEFDRGSRLEPSMCIHCGMERDYDQNPTDGPVM